VRSPCSVPAGRSRVPPSKGSTRSSPTASVPGSSACAGTGSRPTRGEAHFEATERCTSRPASCTVACGARSSSRWPPSARRWRSSRAGSCASARTTRRTSSARTARAASTGRDPDPHRADAAAVAGRAHAVRATGRRSPGARSASRTSIRPSWRLRLRASFVGRDDRRYPPPASNGAPTTGPERSARRPSASSRGRPSRTAGGPMQSLDAHVEAPGCPLRAPVGA
jgi:hypothetical protein